MKKRLSRITCFAFALTLFCLGLSAKAANEPYEGYGYNVWREVVDAPNVYEPAAEILGTDVTGTDFAGAPDFYFCPKTDSLSILDSGNGRVVILNSGLEFMYEITEFTYGGEKLDITGAQGIFTDETGILIADTKNGRILVCDTAGVVLNVITKPISQSFDADRFAPRKLLKDAAGNIYALCEGVYEGAVIFDENARFVGYFGSNRVEVTLAVMADNLWKSILTQEQQSQMMRYVPVEYKNFDIDLDGFIYTCTASLESSQLNTIKRLNYTGEDIYDSKAIPMESKFGELKVNYTDNKMIDTQFVDVKSDDQMFLYGLDGERGKIYQYDQNGNMVSVFGAKGDVFGLSLSPSAIECIGSSVLVLDSEKNAIIVYTCTEYGAILKNAFVSYNKGQYEQSLDLWKTVLSYNTNYFIAYRGIAQSLYDQGKYSEAMRYFKLGYDQAGYSAAFKEQRVRLMRQGFWSIIVLILLAMAVPIVLRVLLKRKKPALSGGELQRERKDWVYLFRMLRRPINTFEDIRYLKKENYAVPLFLLALWFFAAVLQEQFTGFTFSMKRVDDVNVLFILLRTIGLFLIFTVANWSICTLTDGSGRFKQIFTVAAYALTPVIISTLLTTVLSNMLIMEESMFLTTINFTGVFYGIILLLFGFKEIHQFSFGKAVTSTVLTVIGVFIILFILLLLASLIQQLYIFIVSVYNEIATRSIGNL